MDEETRLSFETPIITDPILRAKLQKEVHDLTTAVYKFKTKHGINEQENFKRKFEEKIKLMSKS